MFIIEGTKICGGWFFEKIIGEGFKICSESLRKIYLGFEKIIYGVAPLLSLEHTAPTNGCFWGTPTLLLHDLKSSVNRLKKVLTFPSIFI